MPAHRRIRIQVLERVELLLERIGEPVAEGLRPALAFEQRRAPHGGDGPLAHPEENEAALAEPAVLHLDMGGESDHRVVAVPPRQLHEARLPARSDARNLDCGQHLARLEGGLVKAPEERVRVHGSGAALARNRHARAEGNRAGRELGRRVGERDGAAEGAAIAHRRMGDMRHGAGDERRPGGDEVRGLHLRMAGHGADPKPIVGFLDARKARHAADIDQHLGRGEPHVEGGHQALAAGEDSRVLPVLVQHGDGVFEACRPDVGEWGRFHERVPPLLRRLMVVDEHRRDVVRLHPVGDGLRA